jgi:hypothetical protein
MTISRCYQVSLRFIHNIRLSRWLSTSPKSYHPMEYNEADKKTACSFAVHSESTGFSKTLCSRLIPTDFCSRSSQPPNCCIFRCRCISAMPARPNGTRVQLSRGSKDSWETHGFLEVSVPVLRWLYRAQRN